MGMELLPSFDEEGRDTENAVSLHTGNPNLANQSRLEFSTAEYIPKYKAAKRHRVLSSENRNSASYPKGQAGHNRAIVSANILGSELLYIYIYILSTDWLIFDRLAAMLATRKTRNLKCREDKKNACNGDLMPNSKTSTCLNPSLTQSRLCPGAYNTLLTQASNMRLTHIYVIESDSQIYPSSP